MSQLIEHTTTCRNTLILLGEVCLITFAQYINHSIESSAEVLNEDSLLWIDRAGVGWGWGGHAPDSIVTPPFLSTPEKECP